MGLDGILDAIRTETAAEIAAIRRKGEERRAALLERAQGEAQAAESEGARARDAAARRRRDRIVNRVRLAADRELRAVGESVLQDAIAAAQGRIAALRGTPRYASLLWQLVDECFAVLPDARIVETDPRDAELVQQLLEEQRVHHLTVDGSLATGGGVVFAARDGRRVDNTIEARVRRGERYLRQIAVESIPPLRERIQ